MIIKREVYKKIQNYLKSPEAIVVTGMRRVGKTTLMQTIFNEINSENKLFLDLENTLNQKYFEELDYENIVFYLKTLGLNFSQKTYIFLDEIQFVKNLPSIVKYLIDHYKVKFFLTGSSSFYLKNQFSESLAGRKYIFEIFPLSFKEFLLFKNSKLEIPSNSPISKTIYEKFDQLYEEYLQFGGFPGVVLKEAFEEKKMAIRDIFSSFFQLEVLQLSDFKNTKTIRDLMLLLMQRAGTKLDVLKLANELNTSRETIYNYLEFLEDTYFIKLIRPFSRNRDTEIRKTPKIYICDSGLLNNLARVDAGTIFENSIFQNLRLKGELNYYQTKDGQEIDFILNKEQAFEVKIKPSQSDVKKLAKLCQNLKIDKFGPISKKYSELKKVSYGFLI